jgi:hypothetical protein
VKPSFRELLLQEIGRKQDIQIELRRSIDRSLEAIERSLHAIAESLETVAADLSAIVLLLTPPAMPATIVFSPQTPQESP